MSKRFSNCNDKESILCVAYLSVEGEFHTIEHKEKKQLRELKEYAEAHNIKIEVVMHKDVLGQEDVNKHFDIMLEMIKKKRVKGIIVKRMMAISPNVPDAYHKIGKVNAVGGVMITMDEGQYQRLYIKKGEHHGKENS